MARNDSTIAVEGYIYEIPSGVKRGLIDALKPYERTRVKIENKALAAEPIETAEVEKYPEPPPAVTSIPDEESVPGAMESAMPEPDLDQPPVLTTPDADLP